MKEEDYIEKKERLIPLTQGQFAIVDEDKYEKLIKYRWLAQKTKIGNYYAIRFIDLDNPRERIFISMSHEVLDYPSGEVDHKNHNTLDNRLCNVRTCSRSQNQHNRRKKRNTSSIFKGVTWIKKMKRWYSHIVFNGNNISLGYFNSEVEAAKAYDNKALELCGEFALINLP